MASVTGQLLLGRKRVENWAVWWVVNVVRAGPVASKGQWLTVVLYAVLALRAGGGGKAGRRLVSADG